MQAWPEASCSTKRHGSDVSYDAEGKPQKGYPERRLLVMMCVDDPWPDSYNYV